MGKCSFNGMVQSPEALGSAKSALNEGNAQFVIMDTLELTVMKKLYEV